MNGNQSVLNLFSTSGLNPLFLFLFLSSRNFLKTFFFVNGCTLRFLVFLKL